MGAAEAILPSLSSVSFMVCGTALQSVLLKLWRAPGIFKCFLYLTEAMGYAGEDLKVNQLVSRRKAAAQGQERRAGSGPDGRETGTGWFCCFLCSEASTQFNFG